MDIPAVTQSLWISRKIKDSLTAAELPSTQTAQGLFIVSLCKVQPFHHVPGNNASVPLDKTSWKLVSGDISSWKLYLADT